MRRIGVYQGKVRIIEDEDPRITEQDPYRVLVKMKYSAISTGTEIGLLHDPNFPDGDTLGYTASGVVVDVGAKVTRVRKGDFVACYGSPYVCHAELQSIPEILCVKLSSDALLREASFIGLGTIAMHGVRKLGLQFGDTAWVMGLGVIGQFTAKLCELAGYATVATDIHPERVRISEQGGVPFSYLANDSRLDQLMNEATRGVGFDGISLCISAEREGVIDECVHRISHGGQIVIVGNTTLNVPQHLLFHKEAQITASRAGGPGRYDTIYENDCVDYPRDYVRWTEGRNMQEFIRLMETGKVDVSKYITHEFKFEEAPNVFPMLEKPNDALGVVFRYE